MDFKAFMPLILAGVALLWLILSPQTFAEFCGLGGVQWDQSSQH